MDKSFSSASSRWLEVQLHGGEWRDRKWEKLTQKMLQDSKKGYYILWLFIHSLFQWILDDNLLHIWYCARVWGCICQGNSCPHGVYTLLEKKASTVSGIALPMPSPCFQISITILAYAWISFRACPISFKFFFWDPANSTGFPRNYELLEHLDAFRFQNSNVIPGDLLVCGLW